MHIFRGIVFFFFCKLRHCVNLGQIKRWGGGLIHLKHEGGNMRMNFSWKGNFGTDPDYNYSLKNCMVADARIAT